MSDFEPVLCPQCGKVTMPPGNKFCCYKCWKENKEKIAKAEVI